MTFYFFRLQELQSRALLCLSNVVSALDGDTLTKTANLQLIWANIYSLANQTPCKLMDKNTVNFLPQYIQFHLHNNRLDLKRKKKWNRMYTLTFIIKRIFLYCFSFYLSNYTQWYIFNHCKQFFFCITCVQKCVCMFLCTYIFSILSTPLNLQLSNFWHMILHVSKKKL